MICLCALPVQLAGHRPPPAQVSAARCLPDHTFHCVGLTRPAARARRGQRGFVFLRCGIAVLILRLWFHRIMLFIALS